MEATTILKVADKLNLKQTPTSGFKVGTSSGAYLQCNSKCEQVTLNIQGHDFVTDMFVLEIKGSYVVLGVQWLIELGTTMTNYKDLTMQFTYGGKEVKLQAESIMSDTPSPT